MALAARWEALGPPICSRMSAANPVSPASNILASSPDRFSRDKSAAIHAAHCAATSAAVSGVNVTALSFRSHSATKASH